MYLWDANILRHFAEGHPNLQTHLQRVPWSDIALPSVVVAEVLRGRSEHALKATQFQAPLAHRRLMQTIQLLQTFHVVLFDEASAEKMEELKRSARTRKRYADALIAATALAGNHIVVTRNLRHFVDLLPPNRLENWIDD